MRSDLGRKDKKVQATLPLEPDAISGTSLASEINFIGPKVECPGS